jgi:hypothetical protein
MIGRIQKAQKAEKPEIEDNPSETEDKNKVKNKNFKASRHVPQSAMDSVKVKEVSKKPLIEEPSN